MMNLDDGIRKISIRIADPSLSRRGMLAKIGRTTAAISTLGFALTGFPVLAMAGSSVGREMPTPGSPVSEYKVVFATTSFDPKHLHNGQELLPHRGGGSVTPLYPVNESGCDCASMVNPCKSANCCVSSYGLQPGEDPNTRYWDNCSTYYCNCNPCGGDDCCTYGRGATYEYQHYQYTCCDGSIWNYRPYPTGNYGCDAFGTCYSCSYK